MMRKRVRGSFLNDLLQGYELGTRIRNDMNDAAMRHQLADVSKVTETTVASGEEAQKAGLDAYNAALSAAETPEDRARVERDFAPTLTALEAEKARPASTVQSFGTGQNFQQAADRDALTDAQIAAREGIYRRFGKDAEADRLQDRALNRKSVKLGMESAQLNIDAAKYEAGQREKISKVDEATAAYAKTLTTNPDGTTRDLTSEDSGTINRFRVGALLQQGLSAEANKLTGELVAQRTHELTINQAERKNDAHLAALAWNKGDMKLAMALYNKHVKNNEDAIDAQKDGKGNVILTMRDTVTGETYRRTVRDDQMPRMFELMGGDAGTLAQQEARDFERRIRTGADGRAAAADRRAQEAHELALPAAQLAATQAQLQSDVINNEHARMTSTNPREVDRAVQKRDAALSAIKAGTALSGKAGSVHKLVRGGNGNWIAVMSDGTPRDTGIKHEGELTEAESLKIAADIARGAANVDDIKTKARELRGGATPGASSGWSARVISDR